jgi:cephalosporin hydroxylase
VSNDADLIIDDGLHSPNANIAVIRFALEKIKVGGWIVVEDILEEALPIWQVISALLPSNYRSTIIKCIGGYIFTIERLN